MPYSFFSIFSLDFNYPHQYKAGLTVLHYFIFGNRGIPWDILESFNAILQGYNMLVNQDVCLLSC